VTARVVRVLAPNPSVYTLRGTNTWIVGSDPSVVIDPGPAIASHLEEVARVAGRVGATLLTHRHEDHATGAPAFAEMTGAPVLSFGSEGATHLHDEQVLAFGDLSLVAFHVPGHSTDSVALLEPESRTLFTGDTVLGRGTSFIDPPEGDVAAYLRSLRRLRDLDAAVIYPGHGPAAFRVREKLDEYLHHRVERERQVLSALGDDGRTAEELVPSIYAEYPKEAWPLAARSVLAHLLKLETEGRVRRVEPEAGDDDARFALTETHPCARCGRPVRGAAPLCEKHSLEMLQEPVTAPTRTEPRSDDPDGADAARPIGDSASG
jgi:glyoxylase-like metal-dependent hydrolase (beta-lactamase superfamily II)